MTCSRCGADLPEGLRFCDQCGAPLAGAAAEHEEPPAGLLMLGASLAPPAADEPRPAPARRRAVRTPASGGRSRERADMSEEPAAAAAAEPHVSAARPELGLEAAWAGSSERFVPFASRRALRAPR